MHAWNLSTWEVETGESESWLHGDLEVSLCYGVSLTIPNQATPAPAAHHTEWGTGDGTVGSLEAR